MSMVVKFLTDVGVGKKVEEWLAENGYDVKAIRDLNPRMSDQEILSIAVRERRLVITMGGLLNKYVMRDNEMP